MSMIERAEYDFKISKLYSIAKALDVDICELFDFINILNRINNYKDVLKG